MESRKWRGQYPRLRLLLNSQWRHGVISGSPAFSSLFGILSVLGADWVGNATGSGWAVWPMSSRSVFSACRKKDSARHSAFAVCVNTFVPSCRLIYGVKTWYGVARFWIHHTSFHVLRASPIASSICFRWCCRNVDSQIHIPERGQITLRRCQIPFQPRPCSFWNLPLSIQAPILNGGSSSPPK